MDANDRSKHPTVAQVLKLDLIKWPGPKHASELPYCSCQPDAGCRTDLLKVLTSTDLFAHFDKKSVNLVERERDKYSRVYIDMHQ